MRAEFPESHPGLVTIRVVQYSLQHDHLHLLVEAEGAAALSNGMKSLAARLARAVNRVFDRRGAVLDGRYHHRALGTPWEVRAALAYVLLNARKHAGQRAPVVPDSGCWVDPASSGRWFGRRVEVGGRTVGEGRFARTRRVGS